MSAPRSFDYDYLRRLIRENPNWSLSQYASAVTVYERETRKDPNFPAISPPAIGSVRYRYRDAWQADGIPMNSLKKAPVRTQPFANVPAEYFNHSLMEVLRTLTRISRGDPSVSQVRRTTAVNAANRLVENGQVIDLRPSGQPYIRDARPDELDQEGDIIQYHARYPGLTDKQWRALGNAELRRAAASRFMTDFQGPTPGEGEAARDPRPRTGEHRRR